MVSYPIPKFLFEVNVTDLDLKNELTGGFTEVSGLDVETELLEYRAGNMPQFSKIKQAGMQKYSNITLKRGVFAQVNSFYTWWRSAVQESDTTNYHRNMTINLKNEKGEVVMTWTVTNAFPIKVQSTDLKADANEIAIESMELAIESLTMTNA